LRDGKQPEIRSGIQLNLKDAGINITAGDVALYDPWKNRWMKVRTDGTTLVLPDFRRSLVIKSVN
jgi:hypothetical protein